MRERLESTSKIGPRVVDRDCEGLELLRQIRHAVIVPARGCTTSPECGGAKMGKSGTQRREVGDGGRIESLGGESVPIGSPPVTQGRLLPQTTGGNE